MKSIFFFLLTQGVVTSVFPQVEVNRLTNLVQSVSSGSAAYGSGFKGTYNVTSTIKGDPYLDSTFRMSYFKFYKTAERINAPSRYDVMNNELEIKTTGGIMVLPSNLVEAYYVSLNQNDSLNFVNAQGFKFEDTKLVGFLQLLCKGRLQLLKLTRTEIVKPSYNPSLEVGDRDAYIVKKETLFYSLPDGVLFKIKSKSDMMGLFGDHKDVMKSFISSNKLGFKSESNIIEIFTHFNSIAR